MAEFRPMLATKCEDMAALKFPVLASPKLDGIRCLLHPTHGVVSRTLKPIPNQFTQGMFSSLTSLGLDGELIVGEPHAKDCFNKSTSGVMSIEGAPEVYFHVFDSFVNQDLPFHRRLDDVISGVYGKHTRVVPVPHKWIHSLEELQAYEEEQVALGYEGIMTRDPNGPYKQGRSTWREQWLVKIKQFLQDEAVITGFVEYQTNNNPMTLNALGYAERSTAKDGKVGANTLGALRVKFGGTEFEIGTGFDAALRQEIWDNQDIWLGKTITFKHQPYGAMDKPRFPVFIGLRDNIDVGEPEAV